MKGDAMKDADKQRRLGPVATAILAVAGVGGGLVIAIYSFIQLRTPGLTACSPSVDGAGLPGTSTMTANP